jgi:hypothetical protein
VDGRVCRSRTVARWLWRRESDSSESASVVRKKKEEWGQPRLGAPYL